MKQQEVSGQEDKMRVDYDGLDPELKEVEGEEEIGKARKKIEAEVADLAAHMERVTAPNLKAIPRPLSHLVTPLTL